MKKTIAVSMIAAAFAVPAAADYTVKGSVECPDIIKEDANENYREFNKWWLLGYFSARNYEQDRRNSENGENKNSNVGAGHENDSIYNIALAYCKKNSKSDWDDAAIHAYDSLK